MAIFQDSPGELDFIAAKDDWCSDNQNSKMCKAPVK